jgi:hypothetical protein
MIVRIQMYPSNVAALQRLGISSLKRVFASDGCSLIIYIITLCDGAGYLDGRIPLELGGMSLDCVGYSPYDP